MIELYVMHVKSPRPGGHFETQQWTQEILVGLGFQIMKWASGIGHDHNWCVEGPANIKDDKPLMVAMTLSGVTVMYSKTARDRADITGKLQDMFGELKSYDRHLVDVFIKMIDDEGLRAKLKQDLEKVIC